MPDDVEAQSIARTIYFGYGSNLWIDQMNRRCPENKYVGVGLLEDWCSPYVLRSISYRSSISQVLDN